MTRPQRILVRTSSWNSAYTLYVCVCVQSVLCEMWNHVSSLNIPGLICLPSPTKPSSSVHPSLWTFSAPFHSQQYKLIVCVIVCTGASHVLGLDSENMEESPNPTRVTSQVRLWTLTAHPPHSFRQSCIWRLRERKKNKQTNTSYRHMGRGKQRHKLKG